MCVGFGERILYLGFVRWHFGIGVSSQDLDFCVWGRGAYLTLVNEAIAI